MKLSDNAAACNALREWMKSQDLTPAKSMDVIAMFIGAMIAQNARVPDDIDNLLAKVNKSIITHALLYVIHKEEIQ